jgi:hypothetical protein
MVLATGSLRCILEMRRNYHMHIHDVMAAADYRMVEGRDWLWDFLGKNCREILFESWGLHDHNEHFPVSAVFDCQSGEVKQVTVETEQAAWRWMSADCHAGYVLACADLGADPWREPGITWINHAAEMLSKIAPALHPERRPDDRDESYRWEAGELPGNTVRNSTGDVDINP